VSFDVLATADVADRKENGAAMTEQQVFEKRDGEQELGFDPAVLEGDGRIVYIGRVRSPWTTREDCPKNMDAARRTGQAATVIVDEPYRRGLDGLERASHVVILTWLDRAARNLIIQKPRHAGAASGVFALRSPARPNPIGLHTARLISIDARTGLLGLEAIDVLDGTPVIDLKPYFASIDSIAEATVRSTNG
jgi:tRNA-Thr(GGU) m(6)t(6)A37 methyltransferase TsaA